MGYVAVVGQSARLIRSTAYDMDETVCQIIAAAARVSTGAKKLDRDEAAEFCRKLIKWGHLSPFEFFDLTFDCVTCRAVSHELVRHRLASYMQESQRYVKYDKVLKVVMPSGLAAVPAAVEGFRAACDAAYERYERLLDAGAKPEDARVVLPEATATHILVKMNLREFRHFLELRTAPAAWSEMRELAEMMKEQFRTTFDDDDFLVWRAYD